MKKKKFVAIVTLLLSISVFSGCSASDNTSSSKNVKYNFVAITGFGNLPTVTESPINFTYEHPSLDQDGNVINVTTTDPYKSIGDPYACTYLYPISSWEYGDSNTIILYLMNGNIIQTSSENVLLYYDPNY